MGNYEDKRKYLEKSQRLKAHTQTNIIWSCLYAESTKDDTNELIYKTETDSQI